MKEGYAVWVVERYIPFPKPFGHHVDLFNLFDAVAVKAGVPGVLGIQACRDGDVAEHLDKILRGEDGDLPNPHLAIWKAAGNGAVVWGWGKKGARGKRKLWTCREVIL